MWWRGLVTILLVASVAAKGKKHRHHKPGRAVLDRLSSTTVGEVMMTSTASGLVPAPVDVAGLSRVEANATCGGEGPEEYCRDTPGKRGIICEVCEGSEGSSSRRHPAAHAVDGDPTTWWQSPTLATGDYAHAELVASLPDKMELLHVIIKSGPSPRPLAWSLELSGSESGDSWRMLRAFGDREHCKRLWDLRPERRRRKARAAKRNSKEKMSCSTQFASPRPLENGEMHVAIGEGTMARRVRITFRAPHALASNQQYYTVRELTLAARCVCHGHADSCSVNSKGSKCDCVHGTCGQHCQRCCNGAAWAEHSTCGEPTEVATEGTGGEGGGTVECSCGERGLCEYDDSGAILCVNCTENRAGPLCDRCLVSYYNAVPDGPCLPCNCDLEGSDGTCTFDNRLRVVSCACLPGYSGPRCDSCVDPAASPPCVPPTTTPRCKCDPRGVLDPTRLCDDVCECKVNVVGERCDACAPGHFGLSTDLPQGCRPCYCSHRATSCVASTEAASDWLLAGAGARELTQWQVTDVAGHIITEPSFDENGVAYIISYEVEGLNSFFWFTTSFSGSQLTYYGGEVRARLFWGVVRGDTGGSPTVGPDVVLIANDGTKLASTNTSHESPGSLDLAVPLLEEAWYNVADTAETIDRIRLMDVLADLSGIMIRAYFHSDQDEIRLTSSAVAAGPAGSTEVCACAAGAAGAHCQRCAWGHAPLQRHCLSCDCNQHAHCDAVGGPCGPCQHNTTGPHCERCLPGHYGNPVKGACKPCACPLFESSNNFSPNCALAASEGDDFVCTQCPDGYAGDHCELCDVGYWGSPTTVGGSCQRCACGGAPCHPHTGDCLTCPPHVEGASCDQCQDGYWFGPASVNATVSCTACACGGGALASGCDARTGQCACAPGHAGRTCDTCDIGYGDIRSGCPPCRCGPASLTPLCDHVTGACACAPGAAPPYCDDCLTGYYDLSRDGCKGCNCSSLGAETSVCDIRTGQCRCRPHVTGRACDTCEEGYWGLQPGGCRRCECGAGAAACHPVTGLCACAPGVGGVKCDACLPGFYGFGPAGCLPCPQCEDGKVCSPETGRCMCPSRTRGARCQQCTPGFWRQGGRCLPCQCGSGATSELCDATTGQCSCRKGWAGDNCERCASGYFGPRCRPCECDPAGSTGPCDSEGRCPCKENVVGLKCSECLSGTFGLSADNPLGCTACFCFGRSAHCTQAQLTRAALHAHAPAHIVLQYSDQINNVDQDSLLSIHTKSPDATIAMPRPAVPVYYELGSRFLGDHVTSYGGLLQFRVEEEGGEELDQETLARFPLVRIYGDNIVLDYYESGEPVAGWHAVRLQEAAWRVRRRGRASRAALMLALQRARRLLLRVATRAPTPADNVHTLLLNVSLDTAVPGLSRSEPALGVELCDCPSKYAAPSCQVPAVGYWLPPPTVHMNEVDGKVEISLEGEALPCRCNGRATKCDPATGHCLNCTGGTAGAACEVCAAGHLGSPTAPGGCAPCPCPSRTRNFAAACVLHRGHVQCLCQPGYSGSACDECAPGYFRLEDRCEPCGCDRRGARGQLCDVTGRCRCRNYATGEKCDRCLAPRHYLNDDGCTACDNCTQTLLDSIEHLTADLHRRADINELSRIPKPFPALLEFAHNASISKQSLENLVKNLEHTPNVEDAFNNLKEIENRVYNAAAHLVKEAKRRDEESTILSEKSTTGLDDAIKYRRKLGEEVIVLNEFAIGEKHTSAHKAIKEAKHLVRQMKEISLLDSLDRANDVSNAVNQQSKLVEGVNDRWSDLSRRINSLLVRVDSVDNKSDDVTRLGEVVWGAGDEVAALARDVRRRLSAVRDAALRCKLVLEDITSQSPQNLTIQTGYNILASQTLARKFPALTSELENLTASAEEKEGILYELTPKYREKYLKKVEEHVADLGRKAKEYKSIFSGAVAASSTGVSAARAWSDVAEQVQRAAAAAAAAATAATAAAALAAGPPALPLRAAASKRVSEKLKEKAAAMLARSDELGAQLEGVRRGADVVAVALRGLGWQERELAAAPAAHVAHTLAAAGNHAERVFATTRALYDEASEIRRKARYSLRSQLAELQRHGDTVLSAAQEHVSQIRSHSARGAEVAAALAAAAAARRRERHHAGSVLTPTLTSLKEKIARARHAAETISVSITSVPGAAVGCSREYRLRVQSAAVSVLSVAVSFHGEVRDGTLLTVLDDHEESKRYMKLDVRNRHLLLTWDLGSGPGLILHPDALQPTVDDGDHLTYRIQIQRIWSTFHLTIEHASHPPSTASNSTSGATSLTPRALYLGGASGGAGLPGCVHTVQMRDELLGLWAGERAEGKCTGCTHRQWSPGSGRQSLSRFNGRGYAELRRSPLRPATNKYFSIAFTFRTTDENALLFTARDVPNNRSVSVILRDCRVMFVVQYSGARLQIAAGGRHCHGAPAHVQATRAFSHIEKGSLRVNGEETLGSPSPPVQSAAQLPDLAAALYWVGGAPPAAPPAAAPPPPPLLGCLGALTIDREGYDLMDTPTRHGVEAGCGTRSLHSAVLEGSGHIELASPLLRRKATLGLSFRSRGAAGLLLLRAPSAAGNDADDEDDGDERHYLMVRMVQGEIEVKAAAGKAEVILRTNGTRFDDQRLHSLRIIRQHKQLELWIDDEKLSSGTLPGNSYPARSRGLYVGGAPHHAGFTGTLADLVIDNNLIGFESGVNWTGVKLGRFDTDVESPRDTPRALQAQPDDARSCAKQSASYAVEAGAAKFGDAADSHARLRPGARAPDLTYSLHFRTFAANGLLMLVPGPKSKPKHYLALMVKDHKLRVVVRGRRRKEATLPANVTDGTWRTVSLRSGRTRVSVSSGGAAAALHAAAARAHHLYIGGAPPPHALPNSITRLGGFIGCVRRVYVGGQAQDLVRDAQAHRGLGQCAPNVERGAHFAGDAYALALKSWEMGAAEESEWRLQFRAAAPSGVLISAGSVTLELQDNMVVLSLVSAGGAELARAEAAGAGCGGWTALAARAGRGGLALHVAGRVPARAPPPALLRDTDHRAPLYVAGLPEAGLDLVDNNKENFKGCIKDLYIDGRKLEWTHMETLHNVQLDACPLT